MPSVSTVIEQSVIEQWKDVVCWNQAMRRCWAFVWLQAFRNRHRERFVFECRHKLSMRLRRLQTTVREQAFAQRRRVLEPGRLPGEREFYSGLHALLEAGHVSSHAKKLVRQHVKLKSLVTKFGPVALRFYCKDQSCFLHSVGACLRRHVEDMEPLTVFADAVGWLWVACVEDMAAPLGFTSIPFAYGGHPKVFDRVVASKILLQNRDRHKPIRRVRLRGDLPHMYLGNLREAPVFQRLPIETGVWLARHCHGQLALALWSDPKFCKLGILAHLTAADLASWREDHFFPYDLDWLLHVSSLAGVSSLTGVPDPVRFLVMCKPLVNRLEASSAFLMTWLQYGLSAVLRTIRDTDGDLLPELVARRPESRLSGSEARTLFLVAERKLGDRVEAHDLVSCLVHLGAEPVNQVIDFL